MTDKRFTMIYFESDGCFRGVKRKTNKRFEYNINKHTIEFDKKHFAFFNGEEVKIVRKLNELADENQQYKILINELKRQNKKLKGRLNDLGVEYYD